MVFVTFRHLEGICSVFKYAEKVLKRFARAIYVVSKRGNHYGNVVMVCRQTESSAENRVAILFSPNPPISVGLIPLISGDFV